MSLFELAELELIRERKKVTLVKVVDYAVKIRRWLDIDNRNKAISKAKKACFSRG